MTDQTTAAEDLAMLCYMHPKDAAAEIEQLRMRLRKIANAPVPQTNEIAVMLTEWAQPRDGEVA